MGKYEIEVVDRYVSRLWLPNGRSGIMDTALVGLLTYKDAMWQEINGAIGAYTTRTGGYGKSDRTTVYLYRLICGLEENGEDDDLEVDHINHIRLDERSLNLRVVTGLENRRNRRTRLVYIEDVPWLVEYARRERVNLEVEVAKRGLHGKKSTIGTLLDIVSEEAPVKYETGWVTESEGILVPSTNNFY